MADASKDFAKLYRIDGIGQVLVLLTYDDDEEKDGVTLRIPDCMECELSMRLALNSADDRDRCAAWARKIFDDMDICAAATTVRPLIEMRDRILGGGNG